MKKLWSVILCGAMVLSLAACGGGTSSNTAASGGSEASTASDTLRVVISQDPGTLEPGKINTQTYFQVVRQIYEPLFTFMPDGTLEKTIPIF